MVSGALTSRELTQVYLHRIRELNPLLRRRDRNQPEAVDRGAARRRAPRGPPARPAARHPDPGEGQHRDRRHDADDRRLARAGEQQVPRMRRSWRACAPPGRDPRQGEPVGVGELPRLRAETSTAGARAAASRAIRTSSSFDPCGSSSGSAVAPAANLCAAAVGTETDGSIVCPSRNNLVFGLKPTLGLLSQDGIIPIAHSQDTAGPMARTVTDVAILLGVMRRRSAQVAGQTADDYTPFLVANALPEASSASTSDTSPPTTPGEPDMLAVAEQGIAAITSLGATVVPIDTGDIFEYSGAEFMVLLLEFKAQVAEYLDALVTPRCGRWPI